MTKILNKTLLLGLMIVMITTSSAFSLGSSSSSSSSSNKTDKLFQEAKSHVDQDEFAKALPLLEKAHRRNRKDAKILNLLAYTQRNLGEIDLAIENYHLALKIDPNFAEAREYLGEAYLQAALRELETLKSYGSRAEEEYNELKEAIEEVSLKVK